ncbi:MAG: hypothetical protein AB7O24_12945 [Kofleriaceae bacterium]
MLALGALGACYEPAFEVACQVACSTTAGCPRHLECDGTLCARPGQSCRDAGSTVCPACVDFSRAPVASTAPIGQVCDHDGVLDVGGTVAGLSYTATATMIGPNQVTSCVAAEFDPPLLPCDQVQITVGRQDACNRSACSVCESPTVAAVYVGSTTDPAELQPLSLPIVTADLTAIAYSLRFVESVRFVVVCRPANGPAASDIVVDAVRACRVPEL